MPPQSCCCDQNAFLSAGQAARTLGVARSTVHAALKRGTLRCAHRTPSGHARIAPREVERYRAWRQSRAGAPQADGACSAAHAYATMIAVQAARLTLVQQTARHLAVTRSVQDLCDRLVEAVYTAMGQHVVGVYRYSDGELWLVACRAPAGPVHEASRLGLGVGIVGHVAASGRPYLCRNTAVDPYFHRASNMGTGSEIAVPIYGSGGLMGVLNVESPRVGAFDDDDLSTLSAIADQAAIAMQNVLSYEVEADLRQRAETRARRIVYVQRAGERLKADLDEHEVGLGVVAAAREALGFRMAVLNLVDRPGDRAARGRVVATAGLPPEGEAALTANDFSLADVETLFRPEFLLSRSYFIPAEAAAILADSAVPNWTPEIDNVGADAWRQGDELLVPLTDHDGGHLLGFLSVDDPENGRRPEQEDVEVLEIFADQAVVALRTARLLAQARYQAARDPVTGLLNYRAAHARLDVELRAAYESGQPLGLLTLDMDDFKLINDTHGHPTGDMALRHVAALLERCVRTTDLAARLGGDEFVLILPGASRAESLDVARRLTALADELALEIPGAGRLPLRLSIGVAAYPDDADGAHALLAASDSRLYEAKRAGGRTVEAGRDLHASDRSGDEGDLASFDMLSALVTAVDNKDRYTGEHSAQVATFACALADALGLSPATQRTLRLAGLLHDVGKIGVPDRVLRKPGKLDADEWEAMKQHVALSATLVRAVVPDQNVLAAVAHHHERWDGKGYPQGLAGAEVPLLGRIMIVADAVSAMAMDRPYRQGLSAQMIVAELRKGAGSQFDPALVEPFIAAFSGLQARAA